MRNNSFKLFQSNSLYKLDKSRSNLSIRTSNISIEYERNLTLKPDYFFGFSNLTKNSFKFINDNLIVFSNSNNLVYFSLVDENFQIVHNDDNICVNRFFSFDFSNYLVQEEIDAKSDGTYITKLHFIDYNNDINTKINSISLDSLLINLCVSYDGTKFALVTKSDFDTILSVWCQDQFLILDQIILSTNSNQLEISFYPNDSKKLVVIGQNILTGFTLEKNDKVFLSWEFNLPANYVSFKWLNSYDILIGDDSGHIILFNVLKQEISKIFKIWSDFEYIQKIKSKILFQEEDGVDDEENDELIFNHPSTDLNWDINNLDDFSKRLDYLSHLTNYDKIRQILTINNGFICFMGTNKIGIYQTDTVNDYILKHFCELTSFDENSNEGSTHDSIKSASDEFIKIIGINASENCLVCFTDWNSVYKLDLTSDLIYKKHILKLKLVKSFHHTSILTIDSCFQKPLIITYAKEGIVKIWNYIDKNIILSKRFEESVQSVSLHPNGLFLAVSFANKLILYSIILNDLKAIFTFKITQANYIKFSNGGKFLGATSLNTIKIFNIWTFEKCLEIKLRIGKIQQFIWLEDDQFIVSCSNSGIICIWNIFTGQRLYEYIEKQVQFKQISIFNHQSKLFIYALDKLNSLRILSCKFNRNLSIESNSNNIEDIILEKTIDLKKFDITCFSSFKNTICFGNDKGHIICFKYLVDNNKITSFQKGNQNFFQKSGICQLSISNCMNKTYLVSAFDNGLLVLCNINEKNHQFFLMSSSVSNHSLSSNNHLNNNPDSGNFKLDQQQQQQGESLEFFNDILITKNDIKKLISSDLNLRQILIEQEDEQNYQLKLKDMIQKEQTKTINYEAKLNLTCLRSLYKEIKQLNDDKSKKNSLRLDKLKFKLEKDLELVKENAELELNKKFVLYEKLNYEYLKLNSMNKEILNGINSLSNQEKIVAKNSYFENIEKIQVQELENEIKYRLGKFKKLTKLLKNENVMLELNEDLQVRNLIRFNQGTIDSISDRIKNLKLDTCFVRKKLFQLKEKFSLIKEKQRAHNENYIREKKNYSTKFDQVENLKKVLEIRQKDLDLKFKSKLELMKKIEQLNKINYILNYELEQVELTSRRFKSLNEDLKNMIHLNEEKLSTIIQKKINWLRQMNDLSNSKVYNEVKLSKKQNIINNTRRYDLRHRNNPKLFKSFFDSCKSKAVTKKNK
ncbi:unnamed protein product [Brachionus calyciflorus]|uniref:Uncharacterized protein n=1 Tax=Brachionus calyciflorus TaxID=104777 RepID=A0A814B7F1_9BILA|nr:unnamed protein product [Brachionus calyciflorus]